MAAPKKKPARKPASDDQTFDLFDLAGLNDAELKFVEAVDTGVQANAVLSAKPSRFAASLYALDFIDGLGHKGVQALDATFGIEHVWEADHEKLAACLTQARVPATLKITDEILRDADALLQRGQETAEEMAEHRNIHVVPGADLPASMQSIPGSPRWLFVQGDVKALYGSPAVALVGTRKPTNNGLDATEWVSNVLSPYPITVVSGLAEGIDEMAHIATLDRHKTNVAFLGHGINFEFPAKTVGLRHRIVDEGGAVATEYLPNERYQKAYFVERNRLQAALSDVVIPVEATAIGGTAHTVRFAQKYKRTLVGISWPGANGILTDLAQGGAQIFDVFTPVGRQGLDAQFKKAVVDAHGDPYPFTQMERSVLQAFKARNARPEDIERFIENIRKGV